MTSADFCSGLKRITPPRSQFPWHATSQDTEQISPDKTVSGRCKARHLPDPPIHRTSLCVPTRPGEVSLLCRSCSSPRNAVAGFLQTPPRGDALALDL